MAPHDPTTMEFLNAANVCHEGSFMRALAGGADIRAKFAGRTALSMLAWHGRVNREGVERCARALLAKGDARQADEDGETPLMRAAAMGGPGLVALLAPASDPLAVDDCGRTALMHAAMGWDPENLSVLLPVSDPNARDLAGLTALSHARRSNDVLRCARLLAPVADLDSQDGEGNVALWHMVNGADMAAAKLLLPGTDLLAARPDGVSVGESLRQELVSLAKYLGDSEKLRGFKNLLDARMQAQEIAAALGPGRATGPRPRI